MHRRFSALIPLGSLILLLAAIAAAEGNDFPAVEAAPDSPRDAIPVGDTLTLIQKPLLNIPAMVEAGDTMEISCDADPGASGWSAHLIRNDSAIPLSIASASYSASTLWWTLQAVLPDPIDLAGMYDLAVDGNGAAPDTTRNAVCVLNAYRSDFYFLHIADSHLVTHKYWYESGADTDTTEMTDLHEVIADINLIHPEFVLFTGDLINEGELEDYLDKRYYTRTQKILGTFDVPVFVISGNHDIGGWDDTPPSDGTARRDWWRFFGWKRLNDPPAGAPARTQDYSFDYGPVHFTGLESYVNYDNWRYSTYKYYSFTNDQMEWLEDDLASSSGSAARVLFYHMDFSDQINLSSLGADMALYGHIHRDEGSITSHPYNLATDNVCDGARAYRLIRYTGGALQPTATLSAGSSGNQLRAQFSPPNDGTADSITCDVINNHHQGFENGRVRFYLSPGTAGVTVSGGTLVQTEDLGWATAADVAVDIPSTGTATVVAYANSTGVGGGDGGPPAALRLEANRPNPFNPTTTIRFHLPGPGRASLLVFNTLGQQVARLEGGAMDAGVHETTWDGRNDGGGLLPSGIYFARLTFEGASVTRKIVLAR
ncbi:MAG: metallophosphoesterase [Candidatus Eisenbacteria bacterium]|nr:metallophosphoesterase [Candidatus Eisenbacteria bacterium]